MPTKASSKPAMILERLAYAAASRRIFDNRGGNDRRRMLHVPLIKPGETYERLATETEKKILTDLKSDDTMSVRVDPWIGI